MARVFISYASQTRPTARRVAERLQALGYEVWWDDELLPHRPFAEVIEERLKAAQVVVVLWSEAAAHSQWVRAEADFARNAGTLVQAAVGGARPPMPFNQIQYEDLSRWSGAPSDPHWLKVAASVAEIAGAPPAPVRARPRRAVRPPFWILAAVSAVVVVLLAGAGLLSLRARLAGGASGAGLRVAILPFDARSPGRGSFAESLTDEILTGLSSDGVQLVSRTESPALRGPAAAGAARRLGVALILDGAVEDTAGAIKVRVRLDDAASHTLLWSKVFDGAAAAPAALQAEVAARSTSVTGAALAALRAGVSDPAIIADYVAVQESTTFEDAGGLERAEATSRRVIALAPAFADAHASLAMTLAILGRDAGTERAAALKAEAQSEARRALALDARAGGAYVSLSLLRPNTDWRGRAALLAAGLAADRTAPMLPILESRLLFQSGRLEAAVDRARQAAALDPLHPWVNQTLAQVLMESGQTREGGAVLADMAVKWPSTAAPIRFWMAAKDGDPGPALAMLDDPATAPGARSAPLWRRYLLAVKSGLAGDKAHAAAALEAAVKAGGFDPGEGLVLLARLGDLDGAFAAAALYARDFNDYYTAQPAYLFVAQARPLRRDVRFMALAAGMGLTDYWRGAGKWPDFCAEPDLAYSCRVEAAKLAPPAGRPR